ncbi:hypothetical protein H359_0288 [Chlamydia ibidis 10-1398/6]|uniref:Uncharacterized protein n=1 Tax=Chlamydia ibidis 10-1398/6 TaxID=1046581 RepID=A0ABP2XEY0_9CHLA|nr:hypothetical protein H359_0288 [Chlamydia ibidis 10-1398/6]
MRPSICLYDNGIYPNDQLIGKIEQNYEERRSFNHDSKF